MARSRDGWLPLLGLGAALALGGCVDMFTQAPPDAIAWSGTTTVGNNPELAECGAFLFELGQYRPATFMWDRLSGRARPTPVPVTQTGGWAAYRQWWLEGYVTEVDFVQLETKLQQPIFFGARPYSVWRGTIADDRMALTESGSPCNREVVLVRG